MDRDAFSSQNGPLTFTSLWYTIHVPPACKLFFTFSVHAVRTSLYPYSTRRPVFLVFRLLPVLFSTELLFSLLFVFGYLLFSALVTLLLLVPRSPFSLAFLSFSQFLWYLLFLFAATFRFSDFFLISSSLWFHLFFSRSIFFFDPRVLCSSLALARFLSPLLYFPLFTPLLAIFLLFAVLAAVHFLLHPSR